MSEWKQISGSITLDAEEIKNRKGSLTELLLHKEKESRVELDHLLSGVPGNEVPYKRYRRGKNRCWCCGLKLNTKEHALYD